jgi:hypothetical protein
MARVPIAISATATEPTIMYPSQPVHDDARLHGEEFLGLDFYRTRATELRYQAMRETVTLKSLCIGALMLVAFSVTSAVTAASVRMLTGYAVVAQTNAAPKR